MRHSADAAHDAADAEAVGDGLAQAVLLVLFDVGDGARIVPADLEADDDEVGPLERLALIGEGLDRRLGAERLDHLAGNDGAFFEALRIDVHQRDARVGQGLALQHVADDVLHEHGGAGANECDLWIGHYCLLGNGVPHQAAISKAARISRDAYSVCGLFSTCSTGPCSTIWPFCMTMTRWHRARTTLRSCEMKR